MIGVAKRGHIVSGNNFIEGVIRKFDTKSKLIHSDFLIMN